MPASPSFQASFGFGARDGARARVALMASDASVGELLDTAAFFLDSAEELEGLAARPGVDSALMDRVRMRLDRHGASHSVRPVRVDRLRSVEHNGYPLRRAQLVVFNRRGRHVTASLSEVARILGIKGVGTDEVSALQDLESQFDRLVRAKVRVPPHARKDRDEPVRAVVNHLVDWDRFASENPLPRPLWGQVVKKPLVGRMTIRWLLGPGGVRRETAPLPGRYSHARITEVSKGKWFRAVVKEYPDRIEWVEPPHQVPDPEDPVERKKAWSAIPVAVADDPDVWPLKDK
jgi:hypothetical protein